MNVTQTSIAGVTILEPKVHGDARGFFMETYREGTYSPVLGGVRFVQDNMSFSSRGVLRGLHFQWPNPQGKLLMVLQGSIFDVAVDIRVGSPTFGKWEGVELSSDNKRQFYVPEGFAHGFLVTSETALVAYKCTAYYDRATEGTLLWNDPEVGIVWPEGTEPQLSDKDLVGLRLSEFPTERLPVYRV